MIKRISNKSTSPMIEIQSRFVRNNQVLSDDAITGIKSDTLLFVKVRFSDLNESDSFVKTFFTLVFQHAYTTHALKVIQCSSTDISNSKILQIAGNLTGNEIADDFTTFRGTENSLTSNNETDFVTLELTDMCQKAGNGTIREVMFLVTNDNTIEDDMVLISPEYLSNETDPLEMCISYVNEICGLDASYKYDKNEIGSTGKGFVNLFNGSLIHQIGGLSTLSKKVPITFESVFNIKTHSSESFSLGEFVLPSFSVKIYDEQYGNFIYEDFTGVKHYFNKVDVNSEEFVLLGIKDKGYSGNPAYCHTLGSYMWASVNSDGVHTDFHIYDKIGNETVIQCLVTAVKEELDAKLVSQTLKTGESIIYNWNNEYLESIENSDGEKVWINYSAGNIEIVDFSRQKMYIKFGYNIYGKLYRKSVYSYDDYGSNAGYINEVKLSETLYYYSSDKLSTVKDNITGYKLVYSYSGDKVSKVEVKDASGVVGHKVNYYYQDNMTKVVNFDDSIMYYYFDSYGRCKIQMDSFGRTVTYNYDEVEDGVSKNLIGVSKVQTNSRNLILNHSFEDSDNLFDVNRQGWKLLSNSNSEVKSVFGGTHGEKCLFVKLSQNDTVKIEQEIEPAETGTFILKGLIKHKTLNPSVQISNGTISLKVYGVYTIDEEVEVSVGSSSGVSTTVMQPVQHHFESRFYPEGDKEWYQFTANTATIPSDAYDISMYAQITTTNNECELYVDELHFSHLDQSNRTNLVDNGYMQFESNGIPEGWNFSVEAMNDRLQQISSSDIHSSILGDNVMRFAPCDGSNSGNKKMFQTIQVEGLSGESLVFSVFGKAFVTSNNTFKSYIKFNYINEDEYIHYFDFDKKYVDWQMLTRSVSAQYDFDSIEIGVEYNGVNEAMVDAIQLYKDSFGQFYNYDVRGNITESMSAGGSSLSAQYNEDNQVVSISAQDGSSFRYDYWASGYIRKVQDISGNKVEFTYDSDGNVIKTKLTSSDGEIIQQSATYDSNGNLLTQTDEHNNITSQAFDYLNRVTQISLPNGLIMDYEYNEYSELDKLYAVVNGVNHQNDITYDLNGQAEQSSNSNGTIYDYEFDDWGRLKKVKSNGAILNSLNYNETVNGINKGIVSSKQYGTLGDIYTFEYDDEDRISKVKLNGVSLVKYGYNDSNQVVQVSDLRNSISKHFSYDMKGNLLKVTTEENGQISYDYDNLGSLQKVTYDINGFVRTLDYEYEYEFNEYSKEGYFARIENNFADEVIKGGNFAKGTFGAIPRIKTIDYGIDSEINMSVYEFNDVYDFIQYNLDTVNSSRISGYTNGKPFNLTSWKKRFVYNKTFYAWMKPTGISANQRLFSFQSITPDPNDDNLSIYEMFSHLVIKDNDRVAYVTDSGLEKKSTLNSIVKDSWNLVGVKLYKEDGETTAKAMITLNGVTTNVFTIDENPALINHLIVSNQDIPSGGGSSSNATSGDNDLDLQLKICLMSIGAYDYSSDVFESIYNEGQKYLTSAGVPKSNGVIYYNPTPYQGMDVITLNGSLTSTKGVKPSRLLKTDSSFKVDKAKVFKYDDVSKKHSYGSYDATSNFTLGNESMLAYDLDLNTRGTIALKFKLDGVLSQERQIFSAVTGSQIELGVHVNTLGKIVLTADGIVVTSQEIINVDQWYSLIVTFENSSVKLYIDGVQKCTSTQSVDISNARLYIGTTGLASTKVLNGLVEMLAYKDGVINSSEVLNISQNGNSIIVRNELDCLGRVANKKVFVKGNEIATNYDYTAFRVDKEINTDGTSFDYEYDEIGNIKKKTEKLNGVIQTVTNYTYDKLGRLLTEQVGNRTETFTYDTNGNILTKQIVENGNLIVSEKYVYSTTVNDQLLYVNDLIVGNTKQQYVFGNSYKGNPSTIVKGSNVYNIGWEGRRLTNFGNDFTYTYNEEGIRIKKVTPFETTTFDLEGSNVVKMSKVFSGGTVQMYFNYDQLGLLIGFHSNGKEYFYQRDITGNINKVIDENGVCVVKYSYNAWGKVTKNVLITTDSGQHNPFLYKGYYYDDEIEMYYCKSRYYDPELGRWISADSSAFINESNANGMNLYTYCNNSPIQLYDPNGNAPWWSWAISGLQLVVGIVLVCTGVGAGLGASLILSGTLGLIANAAGPRIAQFIGGAGSVANGSGAISTGISLWSYGWIGAVAGTLLIGIGTATILFGVNDMATSVSGTNYIQQQFNLSDKQYGMINLGLNLTSSLGTIAGRLTMRSISTKTIGSHDPMSASNQMPYARITRGNNTYNFNGRGNPYWSTHNIHMPVTGKPSGMHWHTSLGRDNNHIYSYIDMIIELIF